MIVDYHILEADLVQDLTRRVKEWMVDKWEPLGPFVVDDLSGSPYKQTMVKYAPNMVMVGSHRTVLQPLENIDG